jgi:hypothetical protein
MISVTTVAVATRRRGRRIERSSRVRPVRALNSARGLSAGVEVLSDSSQHAPCFVSCAHPRREREEVMHMQNWMRSGLLSLGIAGAMIGGGAMVAHAQTSDGSSSSSSSDGSSATTDEGSSEDCPNM